MTAGDRRRAQGGGGFRPDIQGLRAIAVTLVVLCHSGVPHMAGGYVGVDVFFVISGFLITGWLLRRAAETHRVPFGEFYATRARRILPAAALTLAATCVASAHLLNSVRALSAIHDAVWAAAFAANVHFTDVGADYFARDEPPSPIQHFWTLAIEEQFYLVWPVVLFAALVVMRSRTRGLGDRFDPALLRRLAVVVGLGVAGSLVWSISLTARDPNAAYFSALARSWELGVGVLIAVAAPFISRIPVWSRALCTWLGLFGILLAAIAYDAGTAFPGYAALLPVLSTGLVIAGGVRAAPLRGAVVVLGRRPLRLVGDVSYSFYLWHWPVLVIVAGYVGHELSVVANLALMTAAFGLSYVTYRLYENPLRHARSLRVPRFALCLWPVTVLAVVGVASVTAASLATHRSALPSLELGGNAVYAAGGGGSPGAGPTSRMLRTAVAASVTPRRLRSPIPDALAPSIDRVRRDTVDLRGCDAGRHTSSRICHWGTARSTRMLIVIGDSHGQMWMPGFVRFARDHRWQVVPLIKDGCVPSAMGGGDCRQWYAWVLERVGRLHPRAVILSQYWSSWGARALRKEMAALSGLTQQIVVVEDTASRPRAAVECLLARGATLRSCAFPITQKQAETYAAVRVAAHDAGAGYLPTLQWLCASGSCPAVVGNVITYRDHHHLTATYSRLVARALAAELARALT